MAKTKYKLNPDTLTYEVVKPPVRLRIYRALRKLLIAFILASIVNFIFSWFFITPKMYAINRQTNDLQIKYAILNDRIEASTQKLQEIKHRDNSVYRLLFGADTLSVPGAYTPYPDSKYAVFAGDIYAPLIRSTWENIDGMTRLLYLQSLSMDQLQTLSLDKEAMSLAIPAIWPIDKRQLRGNHIGAFGMRNHPVSGRYRMHDGIDLGANRGTPVYATGNGIIEFARNRGDGYGLQVVVDHSFGYKTRYAHLSKILVNVGQQVQRGELIGEVGNTGISTGPHLHYEVMYLGRQVDPINYFRRDMDDAEFERIISLVKETEYETFD